MTKILVVNTISPPSNHALFNISRVGKVKSSDQESNNEEYQDKIISEDLVNNNMYENNSYKSLKDQYNSYQKYRGTAELINPALNKDLGKKSFH